MRKDVIALLEHHRLSWMYKNVDVLTPPPPKKKQKKKKKQNNNKNSQPRQAEFFQNQNDKKEK